MNFFELFSQLGLKEKESKVYLAALELGQADVSELAKKAGLKRPTVYFIVEDLEKKGLIQLLTKQPVKKYAALNPAKLLALEKAKVGGLEQALPSLLGLSSQNQYKPAVRFFVGKTGIMQAYEESLQQPPNSEILAFGNAQAVEESIYKFKDWYIKRRVSSGIKMRAITPATVGGLAVAKRDKQELRQTKILPPEQFTANVEINIYLNKIALISHFETESIAVIIESNILAQAFKQIFEILWLNAKQPSNV
jgi:sugar-specific transcriptional regulator TrmB